MQRVSRRGTHTIHINTRPNMSQSHPCTWFFHYQTFLSIWVKIFFHYHLNGPSYQAHLNWIYLSRALLFSELWLKKSFLKDSSVFFRIQLYAEKFLASHHKPSPYRVFLKTSARTYSIFYFSTLKASIFQYFNFHGKVAQNKESNKVLATGHEKYVYVFRVTVESPKTPHSSWSRLSNTQYQIK